MAKRLTVNVRETCCIVSADSFHFVNGEYKYDTTNAGRAHAECFREFLKALENNVARVIVDNTNTTPVEVAPYMAAAAAYGYAAKILRVNYDWMLAASRNTHGVPARTVLYLQGNLDRWAAPSWWKLEEIEGACSST